MPAHQLKTIALNAHDFAPFGEVIEASDACEHYPINQGSCERFNRLAELDLINKGGQPCLSIFRAQPVTLPLQIKLMERHPLSSQAFYPLSGRSYLVVVAPPGDFDANNIMAFIANGKQGVNYRAGCWHHFCLALDQQADFLVIDRLAEDNNCDEIKLTEDQQLEILL